ncbi:MAG: glycosyltransferase family 61 protein [Dongiaceae bacterium]
MNAPSHIVQAEPQHVTLHDAIATPFALIEPSDAPDQPPRHPSFKAYTKGCLYDADGTRVDLSVRVGGVGGDQALSIDSETLAPEQRGGTWLAGRTLYLGPFMNHYGHFITESLSRYWLQDAGRFDNYVAYPFMHNNGNILIREFHRYLAGLLDVPIDRMSILRSQTVFDEIVVPEQLWTYNVHVNARMRDLYARISARHAGSQSTGRIFLSRTDSPRLGNAPAVEEVFAGFGFRIHYPERMTIQDQLSLYANCEILAGLSGSGMHNCLFTRPGLMTIEVGDARARRHPVFMQRIANELARVDAHFIPFGEAKDIRIDPRIVLKRLRDILGELPRQGSMFLFRLKRRLGRVKNPRGGKKT